MPECRGCGVALAPHELELCVACWEAREREDEAMVAYEPICLEEGPDEASTCYLPLGHDQSHDWTPNDRSEHG
jgi:hypothetical protein